MSVVKRRFRRHMLAVAIAATLPLSAVADEKYDLLQKQVEELQQQLLKVQEAMQQYQEQMTGKEGQVEQAVTKLKEGVLRAAEWKDPDTLIHMAGYADVGYSFASGKTGSYNAGRFSPIFHYQYRDRVMLESELEFQITEAGETDVEMEYMTIDYFLNDYIALLGGKFLSPIGQFRQNQHPSWINKLAAAPPGFGHDGAAPTSEVGVQARGGFKIGGLYANYAAYISNGPELVSAFEDGEFELGNDVDGKKVYGGRFALLPIAGMEIGVSAATGMATVTSIESEGPHGAASTLDPEDPGFDLHAEQARDYDVLGMDFVWGLGSLRFRGEYVKTKIGAATEGVTASPGATWSSWYTQAAYLIPQTRIEPVIRYTDFNPPGIAKDKKQWGLGLNYLISSNVIAKVTYEYNDGLAGSNADINRWLFQLAYGF